MSAETNAALVTKHVEEEEHSREQIRQIANKGKVDSRQLNSDSACVLDHGGVLADLKRRHDQKDTEKAEKQRKIASMTQSWHPNTLLSIAEQAIPPDGLPSTMVSIWDSQIGE